MLSKRWLGLAAGLAMAIAPSVAHASDGVIGRYRLDAHGRVSGVILRDGTEIPARAAQSDLLLAHVRLGDVVRVTPARSAPGMLRIENTRTHSAFVLDPRVVLDLGPPDPDHGPARGGGPGLTRVAADDARGLAHVTDVGPIALLLHDTSGRATGFVMENGTQVHVIPRVSSVLGTIHVGERVRVRGRGAYGAHGLGMWAISIERSNGTSVLDLARGPAAPELRLLR